MITNKDDIFYDYENLDPRINGFLFDFQVDNCKNREILLASVSKRNSHSANIRPYMILDTMGLFDNSKFRKNRRKLTKSIKEHLRYENFGPLSVWVFAEDGNELVIQGTFCPDCGNYFSGRAGRQIGESCQCSCIMEDFYRGMSDDEDDIYWQD